MKRFSHDLRPMAWAVSVLLLLTAASVRAADAPPPVEFVEETLGNGLRVIYAPLKTAPVVHVHLIYHVGSRDERPDRQGFAHLFEHMMFRGSKHVRPEEHMRLIMQVGGTSNAFTSFDQTTYINTIPSNHLEMALYLEADRMASFKVDEEIFATERKVVAEEWRMRYMNQPYGTQWQDFLRTAFTTHSYRWTPIGDMEQLRQSTVNELQDFFNTYYVPNNACLIIAGDIDVRQTKEMVRRYFGWIPAGPDVPRLAQPEPEQTEPRRKLQHRRVPLPALILGYHTADYRSDDHYALTLLGGILGSGRASRLDQLLVNSPEPMCVSVGASNWQLQDHGLMLLNARVLPDKDPQRVEKTMLEAVQRVIDEAVTEAELNRAKTQIRVAIINGRKTAADLAGQLGEEEVFGGDATRVNESLDRYNAVTLDDIQRVAARYLQPQRVTTLQILPDPTGQQVAAADAEAAKTAEAPVAPPTAPVETRHITFPTDYPSHPPMADARANPEFNKGQEMPLDGIKVIVMSDHRLPIVTWNLVMRRGSHTLGPDQQGLAGITAGMLRRGAAGLSYQQLNEDLESRGISLDVSDGGDHTTFNGSTTDQLAHAILRSRQILLQPDFPEDEFRKLKTQSIASLMQSLAQPSTVASRELSSALYGDSPLGWNTTPQTLESLTLDDVRQYYRSIYRPNDALLIFAGDITTEQAMELAQKLLDGWEPVEELAAVQYDLPPRAQQRRIVLIDNPEGGQSTIRMGIQAYTLHNDDKFPGAIAGGILSHGINSRLGRYVRAEKGFAYGVWGYFTPSRQGGAFTGSTDTAFETTADAIEAMFKVFNDLKQSVQEDELAEAKTRVAGSMVMEMQTIQQQASRRIDIVLNDYPLDYFDTYPARVAEVTEDEILRVMKQYVLDEAMTVIVVAPAEQVREQLEKLGEVQVVPMPAAREQQQKPEEAEPAKKAA
jgi:zinc protease